MGARGHGEGCNGGMLAWGSCCEAETTNQRETGDRMIGWGHLFAAGRTMVGARLIVHSALEGAAKPRPYPRPPCGGPNKKGARRRPLHFPVSPCPLAHVSPRVRLHRPRQIFSSDQGLRSSRESIAVAPASSMNLPAAPSNLSLRPVKTAALPRWPMVVV